MGVCLCVWGEGKCPAHITYKHRYDFISIRIHGSLDPHNFSIGRLGSQVVSVLEGPEFKSQPQHCWVTVIGKPDL